MLIQDRVKCFVDQCGFATATNACDTYEFSEWKINSYIFEIVSCLFVSPFIFKMNRMPVRLHGQEFISLKNKVINKPGTEYCLAENDSKVCAEYYE